MVAYRNPCRGAAGKYSRKLGLQAPAKMVAGPVEKLVELKTLFRIPFLKDWTAGFTNASFPHLTP